MTASNKILDSSTIRQLLLQEKRLKARYYRIQNKQRTQQPIRADDFVFLAETYPRALEKVRQQRVSQPNLIRSTTNRRLI